MADRRAKAEGALQEAVKRLRSMLSSTASSVPFMEWKDHLWEAHAQLEHTVLLIKLELGGDAPSNERISRVTPDHKDATVQATEAAEEALKKLKASNLEGAIQSARRARNFLKQMLVSVRR